MLGARRASVTLAAGILRKARLIDYCREKVDILNREKLQKPWCACTELFASKSQCGERIALMLTVR